MASSILSLSTSALDLVLEIDRNRAKLRQYGQGKESWLHPETVAGLFAVYIEGRRYDATTLNYGGVQMDYSQAGVQHAVMQFSNLEFSVDHHVKIYQDTALIEVWQVIHNQNKREALHIDRVDSFALDVPNTPYELLYYTSDWGSEFEGIREPLTETKILETRFGRSSKGEHPWFALFSGTRSVLSGAVAWSGNWVFRFDALSDGGFRLSGGLHDWEFYKDLAHDATFETPPVILAVGDTLNAVSQQYASVGRKHWYPRNALSSLPPVEWNHWWAYEDTYITDKIFHDNVALAAERGVEICMLDAGWFGPGDAGTHWYEHRGDWDMVNTQRFPNGIRPLADDAHAKGMKFGIWCEIEALGVKARLAETHPELVALRNGERLGYVCFGNPQTQEWAYQTLCRLIRDYDLDWIKLDFNLDPGAGCNRTDHHHGAGDGLYEHYQGYYRTLERVRATFPHMVLESCSSGGLRIDLGLLRRTDFTFLSDPDWAVHDVQLFWGATTMLAPDACLHWGFCEWVGKNPPPYQTFNPRDPKLKPHQLDYYTRMSMLNVYGFSQKLPELPAWVEARFDHHTDIYKHHVRRFVREADLYRLTEQPKRDGGGDRWSAFQYSLPDRSEHLLFVFRLPGADPECDIVLQGLNPERLYHIQGFEGETMPPQSGRDLMEGGLHFNNLPVEASALFRLS